jgi:cell division septation protein DedD
LALVLVAACGSGDRAGTLASADSPTATSRPREPDLIAIRVPRAGGVVRASAYPRLDSTLWKSSAPAPALDRVLAFDPNGGAVVAVDEKGAPVRIDLRLGTVSRDASAKLAKLTSLDGSAIYGIGQGGSVNRLTPAGSWLFKPPIAARDVVPQPDGSILVLADRGQRTVVWHMYPPQQRITDTAVVPRASRVFGTPVGDRLYLMLDTALIGLRSRDLAPVPSISLDRRPRSIVTTPSGDRIYVALDSSKRMLVIDRYSGDVDARVELPGIPSELRMDPTGRYVLARPSLGDSAWVIAVGTDSVVGAVATAWRADLPAVLPDGSIAVARGANVVFLDGQTLRATQTAEAGARDAWLFVSWDGFRPVQQEEPAPVVAAQPDTTEPDSGAVNPFEGAQVQADTAPPPEVDAGVAVSGSDSTRHPGFVIQFAALRDEGAARETARRIVVNGTNPRVVSSVRDGIAIHRVVAGPFPTRDEAERLARETGQSFWIYEGEP